MIVYVVTREYYHDFTNIIGVFDSVDKAETYIKKLPKETDQFGYFIYDLELNKEDI